MKQASYEWSKQGIATQLDVAMSHIGKMMSNNTAMTDAERALSQGQALDALSELVKSTVHLMAIVARGPKAAGLLVDLPTTSDEQPEGAAAEQDAVRPFTFDPSGAITSRPFWTT